MTIDAPCPNCGTVYTVRRELIGKRTKCTRCGTPFTIAEVPLTPSSAHALRHRHPNRVSLPISPSPRPTRRTHCRRRPVQRAPPRSPGHEFFGFEQDKSRPRFPALKMVARSYDVLAIIFLIIAAVSLIIGIVRVITDPNTILAVLVSSGMMFVWGLATALMCLFFSQSTRLALQVEQNTRETSEACRRLADHLCAIESEP